MSRARAGRRPWGTYALYVITFLGFLYLFIPLITIGVFSFNNPQGRFNTSWNSFTFDNWAHAFQGSDYTDATIELYEELRTVQPKTGICLQAYLRRTAADIERLRPLDPAIRLVKGAYDEKEAVAYTNRRQVDANFVGLAVSFLLDGRGRPIRLGLGTHDVALIEQIAAGVKAAGIGRTRRP